MGLGPVFHAELVAAARGRRFYALRVFYGLFILWVVTTTYWNDVSTWGDENGEVPIAQMAVIGTQVFTSFAILQGVVFLVMTPVLVAGAIADERQRKTLHYLMASTLTAPEIVGGKAGARLLRLGVFGLMGLPILSLIGLFGGVDYRAVALVYAATASSTFFLAAMSILCSVHAARPRDAIAQAYFWGILWLTIPTMLVTSMPYWDPFWRRLGEFALPVLSWVEASSPTGLLPRGARWAGANRFIADVLWMIGLQVAYGSILLAVAAWRLRPAFRAADGPTLWARIRGSKARPRPRWRLWPRPACGADAMLWKEMHTGGMRTGRRVALVLGVLIVGGTMGYASWDTWVGAFHDAWHGWYWGYARDQREVNGILRGANAVLIVLTLLGLGSAAAASVTSEREGDTWISLAATPLGGGEVVLGKTIGLLWGFRWMAYLLAGCWVLGLLVGAVHPLGVLACTVELAVFMAFVAALGVAVSLRSRNSVQALTVTVGILLILNIGVPIVLALLRERGGDEMNMISCIPFLFTVALIGQGDLLNLNQDWVATVIATSVLGVMPIALAAVALTIGSIRRYDRAADRPVRPAVQPRPAGPPTVAAGA